MFQQNLFFTKFVTLSCLCFLCACTVGPDYKKPSAPISDSFKEISGWKQAEPKDDLPKGAWWEKYQDPVLNKLIKQVNINNQNIIAAQAQYRQALTLIQAAQASYFPSIGLNANQANSSTIASSGKINNDIGVGLNASWIPDFWGQISRTVESNKANAQASAASLEAAALSVRTTLVQTYFQLRIADMQQKLYDDSVNAYKKSLEITKNQLKAGIASNLDVSQAETLLHSTEALATDIGIARAQYEHAIAVLVGVPPALFSIQSETFSMDPQTGLINSSANKLLANLPNVPVGIPAQLLERRPDIANAERLMAAANAKVGIARAAFFPTISISATGGYQAGALPGLMSASNQIWSIGPNLNLPIFDGGARLAASDQAKAAYEQSVAVYRQTVLSAFQNVEDNLVALKLLEDETKIQKNAVESARNATRISLNQYKAGIVNYLTVVTSQATQLNNERSLMTLLNRRLVAHVGLIASIGGDWNVNDDQKIQEISLKLK